jgi:hypothetical protein
VVIGEKCTITVDDNILLREVVVEKTANGKESMKITIKAPTLEGQAQAKIVEETARRLGAPQPVKPVHATGQTSLAGSHSSPPVRPSSRKAQRRGDGRQMREDLNIRSSGASRLLIFY